MIQSNIKAVIFDRGGVVILPDFGRDFRRAVEEAGGDFAWLDRIKNGFRLEDPYKRGEINEAEYWRRILHKMTVDDKPIANSVASYTVRVAKKAWTEVYLTMGRAKPILDLISELRSLGIKTAWLSATQEPHISIDTDIMEHSGLDFFVDKTFTTAGTGKDKDAPLYRQALRQLDCKPEEALFIDDGEQYVQIAKDLHMLGFQMKWEYALDSSPLHQMTGRDEFLSRNYRSNIDELRLYLRKLGVPVAKPSVYERGIIRNRIAKESMDGFVLSGRSIESI